MKRVFRLFVSFPLDGNWSETDDVIQKAVRKGCDGSGAGMGERDISWTFGTKLARQNAMSRLKACVKKLKLAKVNVWTATQWE